MIEGQDATPFLRASGRFGGIYLGDFDETPGGSKAVGATTRRMAKAQRAAKKKARRAAEVSAPYNPQVSIPPGGFRSCLKGATRRRMAEEGRSGRRIK